MIILLAMAAVAVAAPIASVVLVSLASRREDAAASLSRRPSSALDSAARRLLGFHSDGLTRHGGSRPAARRGGPRAATRRASLLADDQHPELHADQPDVPHLVG
jgi:hypothetical protein